MRKAHLLEPRSEDWDGSNWRPWVHHVRSATEPTECANLVLRPPVTEETIRDKQLKNCIISKLENSTLLKHIHLNTTEELYRGLLKEFDKQNKISDALLSAQLYKLRCDGIFGMNKYLDQLQRSQALPAGRIAELRKAVEKMKKPNLSAKNSAKLQTMAASVEADAVAAKDPADAKRLRALAKVLEHPAA